MNLYQQNILDYYRQPRRKGELKNHTHYGSAANPLCGDRLEFFLVITERKIKSVRWQGEGCVLSLAAADMVAEDLEDSDLKDFEKFNQEWLLKKLGVNPNPSRLKCALLPLAALKQAINQINSV